MIKGFILSESLKDPCVLNKFDVVKVIVEKHATEFWHDFKVQVADKDIDKVCKKLSSNIKEGWYAHFWDEDMIYVVLPEKVFKLPRQDTWQSSEYLECRLYAKARGVEEKYMEDFVMD